MVQFVGCYIWDVETAGSSPVYPTKNYFMKKFKSFLLGCLLVFTAGAETYDVNFMVNSEGVIEKSSSTLPSEDYGVDLLCCEKIWWGLMRTCIVFDGPQSGYAIYHLHANENHYLSDDGDYNWNIYLQALTLPFCQYETTDIGQWVTICFVDVFNPLILIAESSNVSDLCYRIYDWDNGNEINIRIKNALINAPDYHIDIATEVDDVNVCTKPIYYNLQGIQSNTPFKGINIVKLNNKTFKVIY